MQPDTSHDGVVRKIYYMKYVVSFLQVYLNDNLGYVEYFYGSNAEQDVEEGKIELEFDISERTAVFVMRARSANARAI
jgi:hypothetical protein